MVERCHQARQCLHQHSSHLHRLCNALPANAVCQRMQGSDDVAVAGMLYHQVDVTGWDIEACDESFTDKTEPGLSVACKPMNPC